MGNTDVFNQMANRYDTPERMYVAQIAAEAIRAYLTDCRGKDAIDFGCGTGLVGINLIEEFKTLLFLDTSEQMLDIVNQKISEAHIQHAKTLCVDLETAVVAELHADCIFMVQVLLHIKDYEQLLRKLYGQLSADGHLLIVDFDANKRVVSDQVHSGFDQASLKEILKSIGFKDVQSKTFYTGHQLFMGHEASLFVMDARK